MDRVHNIHVLGLCHPSCIFLSASGQISIALHLVVILESSPQDNVLLWKRTQLRATWLLSRIGILPFHNVAPYNRFSTPDLNEPSHIEHQFPELVRKENFTSKSSSVSCKLRSMPYISKCVFHYLTFAYPIMVVLTYIIERDMLQACDYTSSINFAARRVIWYAARKSTWLVKVIPISFYCFIVYILGVKCEPVPMP